MTVPTSSLDGSADSHWLAPVLEMAGQAGWAAAAPGEPHSPAWPRIATHVPRLDAGCASAARTFTDATMRRWGVADRADDIVTVVSELVTNAWQHARPARDHMARWQPARLGLLQTAGGVLAAVCDPSPSLPAPRDPDELAESGRGLQVISALSDGWGTAAAGTGKIVWAGFAIAAATREGPGLRPLVR